MNRWAAFNRPCGTARFVPPALAQIYPNLPRAAALGYQRTSLRDSALRASVTARKALTHHSVVPAGLALAVAYPRADELKAKS
jgi:hypothetical protein